MRRCYWLWAVGILSVFHLAGLGGSATQLLAGIVGIGLFLLLMGYLLGLKSFNQLIRLVLTAAFYLVFLPAVIAETLSQLSIGHPGFLGFLLLIAVGTGVLVLYSRKRNPSMAGHGKSMRSGGAKAVPLPRTWRMPAQDRGGR